MKIIKHNRNRFSFLLILVLTLLSYQSLYALEYFGGYCGSPARSSLSEAYVDFITVSPACEGLEEDLYISNSYSHPPYTEVTSYKFFGFTNGCNNDVIAIRVGCDNGLPARRANCSFTCMPPPPPPPPIDVTGAQFFANYQPSQVLDSFSDAFADYKSFVTTCTGTEEQVEYLSDISYGLSAYGFPGSTQVQGCDFHGHAVYGGVCDNGNSIRRFGNSYDCFGPPPVEEAKNNGPKQCSLLEGNPINVGTGNKVEVQTDYQAAGAYPLIFQRTYNSNDSVTSSRIGQHWRHSYDKTIVEHEVSLTKALRADGQVQNFILSGSTWVSDVDITGRLVELIDAQSQRSGWQYITPDDVTEEYDVDGKLISLTNRAGLTQTLEYELTVAQGGDDNPVTLDKVTDSANQTLQFTYDANGRVDTVTDPASEVYRYSYDANGNLQTVTYPDETPADSNDNPTKTYHYEDTNFIHALTGITDENNNRYATWTYDVEGRAITSEHAGGAGQVTITYNADGTSTVVDGLGRNQTYHFETLFGVVKASQVTGGPCTACGGQHQNTTYDSNGYVASRTDFNGNQTTYINNARGLETSRTEAVGTSEERTITTEWHTTFRLPTKITEPGKVTTFTYNSQGLLLERKEEMAE